MLEDVAAIDDIKSPVRILDVRNIHFHVDIWVEEIGCEIVLSQDAAKFWLKDGLGGNMEHEPIKIAAKQMCFFFEIKSDEAMPFQGAAKRALGVFTFDITK